MEISEVESGGKFSDRGGIAVLRFGVTILCICDFLAAQTVSRSGGYQLTEQMLGQAFQFGRILAGADFSASDAAALRSELVAYFQKEPAKQVEAYEATAKTLQGVSGIPGHKPSWLDLALARYRVWLWYGEHQQALRDFQSAPFGRMVLNYNPVLVNSGGMIVTKTDVECQFASDTLIAKAAGVVPPGQAEKDQLMRTLSSRFASLSKEQQEYLRAAEVRLVKFWLVYGNTIKTHAIVTADIRKSVHTPADVWQCARRVENDVDSKYWRMYMNEGLTAVANAGRVNPDIVGLGGLNDSVSRSGDMYRGH